jgi:polysaccharide export outer membrane protein
MFIVKYPGLKYPPLSYPAHLTRLFTLLLSLCAALVCAPGQAQDLTQDVGYTLNAGDSIRIHVYGEEDLTFQQLLIGHNGRISYPFLGELKVTGKSAAQLQQMLINGLRPDYLIDPRISVSIVKYRPFFVNGEVKSPGGVAFQPGLTLRKAISLAGGFTERANKKQVLVIADTDPDMAEQKVGLDYRVQPGDIFTVQDTFF